MTFLSRLLHSSVPTSAQKGWRVGGMEDFMTLLRVYFQAAVAAQLGISNLAALPDLRVFKQTLRVPTTAGRLGQAEKKRCRQMLTEIYGLSDSFFRETDQSLRLGCRSVGEVGRYFAQFQGFSAELMMLCGNLMKWKFRLPTFMRRALLTLTEKTIHDIMTRQNWRADDVRRSVLNLREYTVRLHFSEEWMTQYVYTILLLAKREPKQGSDQTPTP